MSSMILGLIPALGLLGLLGLHLANQTERFDISPSLIDRATSAVLILGVLYFVWLGFARGHVPPLGTSELFQVLGILGVGVYLFFCRNRSFPDKAIGPGLLLLVLLYGGGGYLPWREEFIQGVTPLWVWALLGKGLILWGGACLIWLVSLSMTAWLVNLRHRAANRSDRPPSTAEMDLSQQLQHHSLITLFSGGLVLLMRHWWGWGEQPYWLIGIFGSWIFIGGSWWTRFTWPHRLWWMWTLNLLSCLAFIFGLFLITF